VTESATAEGILRPTVADLAALEAGNALPAAERRQLLRALCADEKDGD